MASVQRFANKLTDEQKVVTVFRMMQKLYQYWNAEEVLYALLLPVGKLEDKNNRNEAFMMGEEKAQSIRDVYAELYSNDEDCIDFVNGVITERYFVKPHLRQKGKERSLAKQDKIIKESLNNVFQILNK